MCLLMFELVLILVWLLLELLLMLEGLNDLSEWKLEEFEREVSSVSSLITESVSLI